jgi:hypothetical protein
VSRELAAVLLAALTVVSAAVWLAEHVLPYFTPDSWRVAK